MARILWTLPLNSENKSKHIFLVALCVNGQNKKELARFNDDLSEEGKQDRIRVNITEAWERKYWSEKFGITEAQLIKLVKQKGALVKNLVKALGKPC